MNKEHVIIELKYILDWIKEMPLDEKVQTLNAVKQELHEVSPFKSEPVDCVLWIKNDSVVSNDYNPNSVAPPEMELLEVSIMNDGYTQPIVTWPRDNIAEVVDGFHRSRVGKESLVVRERVQGYLPIVGIRKEQSGKKDRIASTIRHNRARGKHQIDAMSEIVIELKNRNWKNSRIARELGMDEDEILRLCQITGLQELFKDDDFNKSWVASDSIADYEVLTDGFSDEDTEEVRTVNTSDPNRIFHTWDKWECHKNGFYASKVEGKTAEECKQAYLTVLGDPTIFAEALEIVIKDWKHSCEHYLTNTSMNRIAWLGQAAVCFKAKVPSKYSSGWSLLTTEQQDKANDVALVYLNKWLKANNMDEVSLEEALSLGRQVNIY